MPKHTRRLLPLLLLTMLACDPPAQATTPAASKPMVEVSSFDTPRAATPSAPANTSMLPVLSTASERETVLFDPAGSIGPLRLGMTEADVRALGLPVSDAYAGLQVGPYRVQLKAGAVTFIEVGLADVPALRIGDTVFAATEKDIELIAKQLPNCGELVIATGGNAITCAGGKVRVSAGGPPGIVSLMVSRSV